MKFLNLIFGISIVIVFVVFYSCGPTETPEFVVKDDLNTVLDKNGTVIRNITIVKNDTNNNFKGKKYIYKNSDYEGSNEINLFSENAGYYTTGDTLALENGYVYTVYIRTLRFADTLVIKPR